MVSYLNLPEIFYLGVYQPLTGECEGDFDFREYTLKILDLKNCNSLVIEDFADRISSNLHDDFDCLVVVPPHHCEKNSSGIQILCQKITDKKKLIDATSCLIRHKSINRLSTRGNRSIETHLQSIKVVDQEFIKGKIFLIIDDVSTTGNSLKACQELLKSAGAKSVKSFVLAKTIRCEEDLELFDWQYNEIKESIEEEVVYLEEKLDDINYQNYVGTESEYESEMQKLSKAYDYGDLSDEGFDYFASELEQIRDESHRKIDYESAQYGESIVYDADWQMQALNNLYEFSSLI